MTDIQHGIYNRLPVWGQNVAVSAYGLVIKHRRYGGEFQRYFRELMDSQWFSKDEIEAQLKKTEHLDYSRKTTQVYKPFLAETTHILSVERC